VNSGRLVTMTLIAVVAATLPVIADDDVHVSAAQVIGGVRVHEVRSPYQKGTTLIRVLIPDSVATGARVRTVYLLPVEAGVESRYGDGLKEVREKDLHNKLGVAFVAPTFSHLPWYADHPTDPQIRQESYLLNVVIPEVERMYRVQADVNGRYLLGFSKSGWGAWSLLMRHPDQFARASAWDAPLMMTAPGKYGSGPIFGSQENFDGYCLRNLVSKNADRLKTSNRLVLTGYGNFRSEHVQMHELLESLAIPHMYRDGPHLKHDWHSGWVEETCRLLLEPTSEMK